MWKITIPKGPHYTHIAVMGSHITHAWLQVEEHGGQAQPLTMALNEFKDAVTVLSDAREAQ